ncbi:putative RNA-binding Zn-ribbon protein involved in translation (DUF1610 family) [Desulfofundulus luciae]|uniref:RNA-binding Zn-ribbon protein involved in translation (DUF1610 family) n=1 Tax=Desulfofundulus luciae TaxID=74702 RepID=A0ABU0B339_9FIRM|nr:hypothetical protein [Desulfofundulus luciae]MDQ0286687.1 putative RNA-binding Zn-ribbon protein involved in translation (DUF1610 family) [Desulfofundulus luciae]
MSKKAPVDYRVNHLPDGRITGVEVTCCGRHIGEMRFVDEQSISCPQCGARHVLRIQHNHFHLRQYRDE